MIQPILFFVLGALSLFMLVLLAAPGFRRSAERAARRKLEARLPMSLNEIDAGKDALRAEFALARQRFGHEAKTLRADRNEQAIAAGRALEEARASQTEGNTFRETIGALESERAALRLEITIAEENAKNLESQLAAQERLMEEARIEAGRLEKRFEEASFLASSRQIELVGRESEAEHLGDELRAARDMAAALEKELNAVRSAAEANRNREGEALAKTEALNGELASAEERAARSRNETEQLRREREAAEADRARLETELIEARSEQVGLELEFAALNRLLVGLFPGAAAGGDPAKALQAAAEERDRLEARVATLLRETRDLRAALSRTDAAQPEGSPEAVLREQMLDLAAQVTALAARVEGPGGPIDKALGAAPASAGPSSSLAERIRALRGQVQDTSSSPAK